MTVRLPFRSKGKPKQTVPNLIGPLERERQIRLPDHLPTFAPLINAFFRLIARWISETNAKDLVKVTPGKPGYGMTEIVITTGKNLKDIYCASRTHIIPVSSPVSAEIHLVSTITQVHSYLLSNA